MFGAYRAVAEALPLTAVDIVRLAGNAVTASWLPAARKAELTGQLRALG